MSSSVRRLFPPRNTGVLHLPTADLVEISAWLDASRCISAVALVTIAIVVERTLLPGLPIGAFAGLATVAVLTTVPYRRWLRSRRRLDLLIYTQLAADIGLFTYALALAPGLAQEFHFLYLMVIVPGALFSPLCGLVMATLATIAHLWLSPALTWSLPVLVPAVVFFLVAHQSRFYGDRLVAKNRDAEAAARMAEGLLAVVRALVATPTSGSLLQRVTEMARDLTASGWACVVVRDPQRRTYRVMGLASRTGTFDEEIRSIDFQAPGLDTVLATLGSDRCLAARSSAESPLPPTLRERWMVGPFYGAVLRRSDEALGMLLLGQDDPATAFLPATAQLLLGIAHQTVLALDNARLVDELRAASSLKSEFISTISHELRSPLNAIIGYVDLLRDEACAAAATSPEAAARDATLGRVRFYALQLLEMIQATLDVSRLEAGRLPLHPQPVALADLVAELRSGIPEYWSKDAVALEWIVPDHLPTVELDAPKLVTIVRNLVHNALKFTERGRVEVQIRLGASIAAPGAPLSDALTVIVADTGIGIPSAQLDVVFQMFRQADGSDSRRHGGVGLGLYIVMRLAQALGGTVRVESVPGSGSTFTVVVPVQRPAADEPAPIAAGAVGA